MRFLTISFVFFCALFALLEALDTHQTSVDISSRIGKENWLASVVSSLRRAAFSKAKGSLATDGITSNIEAVNPHISSQHQKTNEMPKGISSALKAILSRRSKLQTNSMPSREKQVKEIGSWQRLASMFGIEKDVQRNAPSLAELGVNSTEELNVMRQNGVQSASPTPIPDVLFDGVMLCKARNPIWNVAIKNKMGDLLIMAYPGSEEKAETFARCIRDDVTTMKREEYLKFAMYNCVGTEQCRVDARGVCSCTSGAPERCINVDYTRALIECKYGPGVGA